MLNINSGFNPNSSSFLQMPIARAASYGASNGQNSNAVATNLQDRFSAQGQSEQASIYNDLSSLDKIRQRGQTDEVGATKQAAKEFESLFMNMMLRSMRQASSVIGGDSPFASQQEKMYTGMLDEQFAANLSQGGHLRIAELMVGQLTPVEMQPRDGKSVLIGDKRIGDETIQPVYPGVENSKVPRDETIQPVYPGVENSKVPRDETIQPVYPVVESLELKDASDTLVSVRATPKLPGDEYITPVLPRIDSELNVLNNQAIKGAQVSRVSDETIQPVLPSINAIAPSKKSLFSRLGDFVSQLMPLAEKAAEKLNIDPKVLVAQAALETGWGKHVMHDSQGEPGFNLFGIKAGGGWQGKSIAISTLEVEQQEFKPVTANFRQYDNFSDSFNDYVNFVSDSPRYQKAVNSAEDAKSYLQELQSAGYATDPDYADKIMRIYNDPLLQKLQHSAP